MNLNKVILWFLTLLLFHQAKPQSDSLSWEEQFAQLELEMDSVTLFSMIDSILNYQPVKYSEWNFRVGYNSSFLSAGRDYGIKQQGVAPGVSFYHKSGVYADLAGYWNSGFDPKYNLTVASVGYMGLIGNHFSYTGSYERWIYTEPDNTYGQFKNSFGASLAYNLKFFYASADYSFLLNGNDFAQRAIGTVSASINLPKWFFDQIKLAPSATLIYGNANVIQQFSGTVIEEFRNNEELRSDLQSDEFKAYAQTVLTQEEKFRINRIQNNERLSDTEKKRRITSIYLSNEEIYNYIYDELETSSNEYGIMNYSFSLPLLLKKDNFRFVLGYTYSVPVALPGENFKIDPTGYFSATVSYRIPLR